MSEPGDAYHEATTAIDRANRVLVRGTAIFAALLLVAALVVIVTAEIRFAAQVNVIKTRQLQFHRDSTCQTAAFNQILTELAAGQHAIARHRLPARFVYPKPC